MQPDRASDEQQNAGGGEHPSRVQDGFRGKQNEPGHDEKCRAPAHAHLHKSGDAEKKENAPGHAWKYGSGEAELRIDAEQSGREEHESGVGIGGHSLLDKWNFPPRNNSIVGGEQPQAVNAGSRYDNRIGEIAMEARGQAHTFRADLGIHW